MSQKIFVVSGKKQSGKSTSVVYCWTKIANNAAGFNRFSNVEGSSFVVDSVYGDKFDPCIPSVLSNKYSQDFGVKIFSFADKLKEICSDLFNINIELMYGSDLDKNQKTEILWEDVVPQLRQLFGEEKCKGLVTIRQLLQLVGNHMRGLSPACWANITYKSIPRSGYPICMIADARYPNEISIGTEIGAKSIRLLRHPYKDDHDSEIALDDFPLGEFSLALDNTNMSLADKNEAVWKFVRKHL